MSDSFEALEQGHTYCSFGWNPLRLKQRGLPYLDNLQTPLPAGRWVRCNCPSQVPLALPALGLPWQPPLRRTDLAVQQ